MADVTTRQPYNQLVIEHRQQTARLHKVEQLVRDFAKALAGPGSCEIRSEDGWRRCVIHHESAPCPFATLLERARDLGLA